jgi:hypothetical protein
MAKMALILGFATWAVLVAVIGLVTGSTGVMHAAAILGAVSLSLMCIRLAVLTFYRVTGRFAGEAGFGSALDGARMGGILRPAMVQTFDRRRSGWNARP